MKYHRVLKSNRSPGSMTKYYKVLWSIIKYYTVLKRNIIVTRSSETKINERMFKWVTLFNVHAYFEALARVCGLEIECFLIAAVDAYTLQVFFLHLYGNENNSKLDRHSLIVYGYMMNCSHWTRLKWVRTCFSHGVFIFNGTTLKQDRNLSENVAASKYGKKNVYLIKSLFI